MSCTSCGKKFSIFSKEHSCKLCGYVFCGSCCNKTAVIPLSVIKTPQKICNSCLHNLGKKKETRAPSPPTNFKKRLEMAENKDTSTSVNEELESRLQQLKDTGNPIPTEEEIGQRLAQLKNLPAKHFTSTHTVIYKPAKIVSGAEQVENLIDQFQNEVTLDSKRPKPEDEIEERLKQLRKDWPLADQERPQVKLAETSEAEASESQIHKQSEDESDSESDDVKVKKLMKQFLEEADLKGASESEDMDIGPIETPQDQGEELPWCVICNEDARFRCPKCSNDLYCIQCFQDFHEDEDDHKPVSYKAPKKACNA